MNRLFETLIKEREYHYCHAVEVNDVYELEGIIEGVIEAYPDYTEKEYIDFFTSIELYCLDDNSETEKEVYDFNFADYISGTID